MMRFRLPFCFFLLTFIAGQQVSCTRMWTGNQIAATLDNVESYINDRPDSALAVLRSVDTTALRTRALRARYSLLRVMALDKCFEDITRPGLLDPAVNWYERHGSADECFKTCHYSGRIAQDRGDKMGAAMGYARAEKLSDKVKDRHALGLMYLAFGSLYNSVHNTQKELEYVEKALDVFQQSEDPLYASAIAQKALVYHSRQEWSKADSLYRKGIERSEAYPEARHVYLSNYARMKVLQPDKDPSGAISLLDEKRRLSGGTLTPDEAGAYAYAAALLGDRKLSDGLFQQLERMDVSKNSVLPWQYRRALLDGKTDTALSLLQEMWRVQDSNLQDDLTDSVSSTLQSFYSLQASRERDRRRIILLLSSTLLLLLTGGYLIILLRKRKIESDRERLMTVCDSLRQELDLQADQVASLSDVLQQTQEKHNEQTDQLTAQLEEARESYRRECIARLQYAGEVTSIVIQHEKKRLDNDRAWELLREELFYIHHLEKNGEELVRRMDQDLNGAISRLRADLDLRGKPREVLFLCCCILDIDPIVLIDLFGKKTVDAIYKKRSRMKEKIAALGNPEYNILFKVRTDE